METTSISKSEESTFEKNYKALLDFKEKYGHCDVPSTWTENRPLRNWVCNTRQRYKGKPGGKPLTPSEIKKLENIGFQWLGPKARSDSKVGTKRKESESETATTVEEEVDEITPITKKVKTYSGDFINMNIVSLLESSFSCPGISVNQGFTTRIKKGLTLKLVIIDATNSKYKSEFPPYEKPIVKVGDVTEINCITDIFSSFSSLTIKSKKYTMVTVYFLKDYLEIVWMLSPPKDRTTIVNGKGLHF